MTKRTLLRLTAVGATAIGTVSGATAVTASVPPPEPTTFATGLTNPRGFTWDDAGNLAVALAGSGGTSPPTEEIPNAAVLGPILGGPTAAVATIGDDGCPAALATGLPSGITATGEVLGADDVAYLGGSWYIAVDGGGAGHGNPDQPSGVYRVADGGSAELVADLSTYVRQNPVAAVPGDLDPDAAGYSIVAGVESGMLWVGDPNSGQILRVAASDGFVDRVADLSDPHVVPTRLALDPAGGVFVGTLGTVPYPEGSAQVLHVDVEGTSEVVWTGLTAVADVAVGADGTLYALELSTGNLAEPPFLTPGSGRIVRQTGPDSAEPVAEGLDLPIAMEIGADGAFYVATPAVGANDGSGSIVRIAPAGGAPPATSALSCVPIEGTTGPMPLPPPPGSAPDATPPPAPATAAATTAPATAAATTAAPAAAAVTIDNFAFGPAEITVAAGTTITFTNNDSATHTATADDGSFDTAAIEPGASATITLDEPGTYPYFCAFHPSMRGTITVT